MLRHKKRDIILLLYVDDIPVAAKSSAQIKWFKEEFDKIFKIKDLREMKRILDIRITRDRKKRILRMNQSHYLSEVLNELYMNTEKHVDIAFSMSGYNALRSAESDDVWISLKNY